MTRKRHERAFTLIELLIVIAIIAILALIAVPNFLEAQTRSKVARAMADMRSVATAVEAYAVDYNTIPFDADDRPEFLMMMPASQLWFDQKAWYPVLTTPVAYLTSTPSDPFHEQKVSLPARVAVLFPGEPPFPYAYITPLPYMDPYDPANGPGHRGLPQDYSIVSLGPSQQFDSVDPAQAMLYDPTNGIVSAGDIVRYGPGGAERRP